MLTCTHRSYSALLSSFPSTNKLCSPSLSFIVFKQSQSCRLVQAHPPHSHQSSTPSSHPFAGHHRHHSVSSVDLSQPGVDQSTLSPPSLAQHSTPKSHPCQALNPVAAFPQPRTSSSSSTASTLPPLSPNSTRSQSQFKTTLPLLRFFR